jgi:hypothetical protein
MVKPMKYVWPKWKENMENYHFTCLSYVVRSNFMIANSYYL